MVLTMGNWCCLKNFNFVVKNIPKKPDTMEFNYYNVSIDRKTYVPMKMEFYDKENNLYQRPVPEGLAVFLYRPG